MDPLVSIQQLCPTLPSAIHATDRSSKSVKEHNAGTNGPPVLQTSISRPGEAVGTDDNSRGRNCPLRPKFESKGQGCRQMVLARSSTPTPPFQPREQFLALASPALRTYLKTLEPGGYYRVQDWKTPSTLHAPAPAFGSRRSCTRCRSSISRRSGHARPTSCSPAKSDHHRDGEVRTVMSPTMGVARQHDGTGSSPVAWDRVGHSISVGDVEIAGRAALGQGD